MGSPLGYEDTVQLLNVGENTSPSPQQGMVMEPVGATVVCNDSRLARIHADAESWGFDPRGVVVIDGIWEHDKQLFQDGNGPLTKQDVLIPWTTIHHITYHFNDPQAGANTND